MNGHRKQIKQYHDPGDCHELTFSCYQRKPLLKDDCRRLMLCAAIEAALAHHPFRLVAFVLMPEHVHLLVYPTVEKPEINKLLFAIKRPFSYRVKQELIQRDDVLLNQLMVRERPGKMTFRFWQEGTGYDRNFSTEKATLNAIDYIHKNPVRRGLVTEAREWKWSSASWYETDGKEIDGDLPTIHGLPWEFFSEG